MTPRGNALNRGGNGAVSEVVFSQFMEGFEDFLSLGAIIVARVSVCTCKDFTGGVSAQAAAGLVVEVVDGKGGAWLGCGGEELSRGELAQRGFDFALGAFDGAVVAGEMGRGARKRQEQRF